MQVFPLQIFLETLADDGLRPTVRDYERIQLALQAGGPWTLARFRDVLLALLVRDSDQQEIFLRRFNTFFPDKSEAEKEIAEAQIDVPRILSDLRQVANEEPSAETEPARERTEERKIQEPVQEPQRGWKKWRLWGGLAIVLLLMTVGGVLYYINTPPPPPPDLPFTILPPVLNFANVDVGKTATQDFTITNNDVKPLRIIRLALSGNLDAEPFRLANGESVDETTQTIPPGESLAVEVTFSPSEEKAHSAFLDVFIAGSESPEQNSIIGRGGNNIIPPTPPKRLYQVPTVTNLSSRLIERKQDWKMYAGIAGGLLLAVVLYGLYLWQSRKIPIDEKPQWKGLKGPRHFRTGTVGGEVAPRLDDDTLGQLADSMGYFQSQQEGRALNIPASIEASLQNGGIPSVSFYKRKQGRALFILEDSFAESLAWNGIAKELAAGMQRFGVPVQYGQFAGSPERFTTGDGAVYQLEDFEDQRQGYVLLIFTDGKGMSRPESAFVLEALAR